MFFFLGATKSFKNLGRSGSLQISRLRGSDSSAPVLPVQDPDQDDPNERKEKVPESRKDGGQSQTGNLSFRNSGAVRFCRSLPVRHSGFCPGYFDRA